MIKEKTIKAVTDNDLCHGCGTCTVACPLSAIEMVRDNHRGLYIPKINFQLCNECSICLKVCPGHSVDFRQLNTCIFPNQSTDVMLGVHEKCYTSYSTDDELRYNGASGGLVTRLLISALEEGYIDGALVTRMNTDNPLEPEPFIARTKDEIISAAKSKYCPVPANVALKEIMDIEGRYAVVGLPCHIHGIRKYEQINKKLKERIILHIGIFCGYTYSFLATDFLLSKFGINRENIKALNYRGEGWPGSASILTDDNRNILIPTFELYKTLELTFRPRRCSLCCDGSAELADISCGDAWLPEFADDNLGTSIAITRNKLGDDLINNTARLDDLHLRELSSELVIKSQPMWIYKKVYIKLFLLLAKIQRKGIPEYKVELTKLNISSIFKALLETI
ncbi:Coenzyme F420 hydrogenase/dehydrogenase, beta subunit C-terminal domain, partial [Chloroflexota bacterium]